VEVRLPIVVQLVVAAGLGVVQAATDASTDDAAVDKAVRTMLDDLAREGFSSLSRHLTSETRRGEGEEQWRRKVRHSTAVYGALRRYEVGAPAYVNPECRHVKGSAVFEHGPALLTAQLCREDDAWMLQSFDIVPERVTGKFFERAIAFEAREKWPDGAFSVTCPDVPVPAGGELTCHLDVGGDKAAVRVQRRGLTGMAVLGRVPD
jgi:hypothetical protein